MNKINEITLKYNDLNFMRHEQALFMRDIIQKNKLKNLCELGHFHGKSSIYIGSILEEQGFGTLTTFDILSNKVNPSIYDLIKEFSLDKFVKPIVSKEGYIWDLLKIIKEKSMKFDFCYFDGRHTFEMTLTAFILIDLLLENNGIIIFDDVNWTLEQNKNLSFNILDYAKSTEIQRITPPIKMICDLIVPNYNYKLIKNIDTLNWAVFQKK